MQLNLRRQTHQPRAALASLRAALLLSAIFACGLVHAADRTDAEPLRFGLASAPVSLDPRFATDAASSRINRLLYRRLVDFDEYAKPVASLARWKQITPTHYRFKLGEEGRWFRAGERLTSADVRATYTSILAPDSASPHRSLLSLIDRIETPDPETIDFHLKSADPLFPGYLVIGIMPARLVANGHRFARKPVGTGALVMDAWPRDGSLRLARRGDGQQIEMIHVADPTVRVLKMLRGEIDMMQNDLPPELVRYLADRPGIRVVRRAGSNFSYLGFNLEDEVSGNIVVRRAIAHAIDREAIIRYVLGGSARVAQALLPSDHWAGNRSLQGYVYDPARARKLLAQAGYDKTNPLRIVYKTSSDPFRVRLATIIQSQLADAGIEVELRSYDWGTFYGDIKAGRFQMYSLSWVGIKTPDIFRYVFHSESFPPQGANRGRFVNAKVDRLIERADASRSTAEQAALYRAVQVELLRMLPYVPLWYEDHVFVSRVGIQGFAVAADGNYDGLITAYRTEEPRQVEHAASLQ